MIRFFRKIRQKLFAESEFRKYALYALGEIALVMVGILLALQVNTWKTAAENREIENNYYCQLLDDLELDKERLRTLRQGAQTSIRRGEQLIKDLHSFGKEKDELLADYIVTVRSQIYVPTTVAFTDLMSSGNLGLLRNTELKKNLIGYYADVESIQYKLGTNRDFRVNKMMSDWDDVLEFGWQSPSLSPGLDLEEETLRLLPNNQWQLDKDNPYFRKMQEIVFVSITIADRETELYDTILERMQPLHQDLDAACTSE